jgi:hypothetical protein
MRSAPVGADSPSDVAALRIKFVELNRVRRRARVMGIEFGFPGHLSLFDAKIWTGNVGGRDADDQRAALLLFDLARSLPLAVASAHHVYAGGCRESADSDWFGGEGS